MFPPRECQQPGGTFAFLTLYMSPARGGGGFSLHHPSPGERLREREREREAIESEREALRRVGGLLVLSRPFQWPQCTDRPWLRDLLYLRKPPRWLSRRLAQ